MRTTVTLEPEIYRMLQEQMHRERKTFKEVLNEAIRRGLEPGRPTEENTPYEVEPHQARLLPGYDPRDFNRLADEIEDAAVLGRATRPAR